MRITGVRTRVVEWHGATAPPQRHFCTNPMDLLESAADSMEPFRFRGWLLVEVFTDAGQVGIGNAALAPRLTKQAVDTYLTPLLLDRDPWDIELLWQLMYRNTMAWGRKGIGMTAISAVDIALWDLLGKITGQPVYRLLGGRTKARIPVYASRLYSQDLDALAAEASAYRDAGFRAMKLRFGWGPTDGAAGMRRNLDLVRTVREVVGDDTDLMADAYMGWTLDYARRMIPRLEPFHLRWLEEPVIPDDVRSFSSSLIKRGFSVNAGRKIALGAAVAVMPSLLLVPYVSTTWVIVPFMIGYFGQQAWSTLVMTLPTDLFPRRTVGSVAGLVGFGGAMGGIIFGELSGYYLDANPLDYGPIFAFAGVLHIVSFIVILITIRRVELVEPVPAEAGV